MCQANFACGPAWNTQKEFFRALECARDEEKKVKWRKKFFDQPPQ
jgi:hypothetical protein